MTKQYRFTYEESLLLTWVKGEATIPDREFDIQHLHQFAKKNGLSPYLFFMARGQKDVMPKDLLTLFKTDFFNCLARNTRIQHVWEIIKDLLTEQEIPFVPLKGIFLAQTIYPDFNTRPMSDLDILIMKGQAKQAFDLLLKNGAQLSGEEAAAHDQKTGHHLPPLLFQGVLIELHTSLFPLDVDHQIPNSFIESSLIQYKHLDTLPPMLNFCYLCLHAHSTMRRGGIRLSWFLDLVLLAKSDYFQAAQTSLPTILQQLKIEKPVMDIIRKAEFLFGYHFPFVPAALRSSMTPDEISDFIHFIHSSGQQDTRYSYAIAFERLKNTKGFFNKIDFIKSVIMRGDHTNLLSIIRRLWTLSIRSLRMLFFKRK